MINKNIKPTYLVGQKFNRLIVIEFFKYHSFNTGIHKLWLCKCECGRFHIVIEDDLKQGRVKSCGCLRKELARTKPRGKGGNSNSGRKQKDLTGTRYGRLVVLNMVDKDKVRCQCDCGNIITCTKKVVVAGCKNDCGCSRKFRK